MKTALLALLLATLPFASPARGETLLKMATLAPEGSSWMKRSREWQRLVESRTAGRVKVKIYAGGVQGDERDMLRKIRIGQLSGAALSAIGLALIDPEVAALSAARTYEELDYARSALSDLLKKKFEERGFVLLAWGDIGPIRLFSKKPVRSMGDLQALKLWRWADDPFTRNLYSALEIQGVPLGIPDVLPGLSTGQIDAFFSSPLPTLALQWSSHVKYATSMIMGQAIGATVVSRAVWEQLSPADRQVILAEAQGQEKEGIARVRADNEKAFAALKVKGLEEVPTPPEFARELQRRAEPVARAAGATFSKEFQVEVQRLLDKYRTAKK